MANRFETKYFYSDFKIFRDSANIIHTKITYADLCKWLQKNRHNLFGVYVSNLNRSWSAEFFLRYETEI